MAHHPTMNGLRLAEASADRAAELHGAADPAPAEGISLPVTARLELDGAALVEAVRGAVRRELADLEVRLAELRELVVARREVEVVTPPPATPAEPDWWTMNDLAAGMGVSVATAYRAASRSDIGPQPHRPTPGRVVYDRAECEAWLKCKNADGTFPNREQWAAMRARKNGRK